jgi:hypothetical protein
MKNEENTTTKESPMVVLFQGDLRDYFAGQALAGYCTRYNQPNNGVPESVAEDAYTLADAMLKARAE